MLSNRESARRSRRRKQAHLGDLQLKVNQLQEENQDLLKKLHVLHGNFNAMMERNRVIKDSMAYLREQILSGKPLSREALVAATAAVASGFHVDVTNSMGNGTNFVQGGQHVPIQWMAPPGVGALGGGAPMRHYGHPTIVPGAGAMQVGSNAAGSHEMMQQMGQLGISVNGNGMGMQRMQGHMVGGGGTFGMGKESEEEKMPRQGVQANVMQQNMGRYSMVNMGSLQAMNMTGMQIGGGMQLPGGQFTASHGTQSDMSSLDGYNKQITSGGGFGGGRSGNNDSGDGAGCGAESGESVGATMAMGAMGDLMGSSMFPRLVLDPQPVHAMGGYNSSGNCGFSANANKSFDRSNSAPPAPVQANAVTAMGYDAEAFDADGKPSAAGATPDYGLTSGMLHSISEQQQPQQQQQQQPQQQGISMSTARCAQIPMPSGHHVVNYGDGHVSSIEDQEAALAAAVSAQLGAAQTQSQQRTGQLHPSAAVRGVNSREDSDGSCADREGSGGGRASDGDDSRSDGVKQQKPAVLNGNSDNNSDRSSGGAGESVSARLPHEVDVKKVEVGSIGDVDASASFHISNILIQGSVDPSSILEHHEQHHHMIGSTTPGVAMIGHSFSSGNLDLEEWAATVIDGDGAGGGVIKAGGPTLGIKMERTDSMNRVASMEHMAKKVSMIGGAGNPVA